MAKVRLDVAALDGSAFSGRSSLLVTGVSTKDCLDYQFDTDSHLLVVNAPEKMDIEDVRSLTKTMEGICLKLKGEGFKTEFVIVRAPLTVNVLKWEIVPGNEPLAQAMDDDINEVLGRVDPLDLI